MDPLIVTQAINVLYGVSTLAVLALGLAVIFGLLGVLNIAHGEFVMIGAYCAYVAQAGGWPYLAAVPLTLAVCAHPRRGGRVDHDPSALPPAVRYAGGDLGLEPAAAQDRRSDVRSRLSQREHSAARERSSSSAPNIRSIVCCLIAISLAVVAALVVWYGRSRTGSRIRAMVSNPELAQAQGISVRRLAAGTFVVGTCLAGLGGVMVAPLVPVQPFMGLDYVLRDIFCSDRRRARQRRRVVVGSGRHRRRRQRDLGRDQCRQRLFRRAGAGDLVSLAEAARDRCARLASSSSSPSRCRFVLGQFWAYQLGLYALYAAAAVGVGLCWGQAGFLPLGQALFFGLAAYLSGPRLHRLSDSPIIAVLALPLAACAPACWLI